MCCSRTSDEGKYCFDYCNVENGSFRTHDSIVVEQHSSLYYSCDFASLVHSLTR